ncbi:hypothetical protein C8Q73DRAFT_703845 [Cubamyces lactineus]|nr:hypothetical protein C8Q73DRAFT_703845 [Cubamyces lactineus]
MTAEALLQIRAQLNLLSPTARLPLEILVQCFEHVMSYVLSTRGSSFQGRRDIHQFPFRPLITITHVCKRWREVALSTSALWTCIDDERPAQMEAFLARSQHTPIRLHLTTKDLLRTALVLNTHASRMRRLDLTIHPNASFIPPILQFEAPLLECLTICSELNPPPPLEHFTMLLFRKRQVNLLALALVGLGPWLPGNCFPQLTHLHLSRFLYQGRAENNTPHLKQLLSNTPSLQYLHVGGFGYDITLEADGRDVIPLPALRDLTFTDSMFLPTLHLFAMLDLPKDVMVRLDTSGRYTSTNSGVPQRPIHSREFLSGLTHIEVQLHDSYDKNEDVYLIAQGPSSGLLIQAWHMEDERDTWLSQLTTILPMPSIKELHVSAYNPGGVLELLRQLPHLTTLVVNINEHELTALLGGSGRFLQELYERLALADPVLVPQLQVLEIHACTYRVREMARFVAMSEARHALGCPLHTVILDVDYDEEDERDQSIKSAFLAAEPYIVKHLDLNTCIGSPSFVTDERWKEDPEAERWWTLPDVEPTCF